jgi:ADP-heptose:LPS heptosyltransferase
MPRNRHVAVHLGSGVGNIVLATPLLIALADMDFAVDVCLDADYHDTGALFADWSVVRRVVDKVDARQYDAVVAAIPPFYWWRHAAHYRTVRNVLPRPPDAGFYVDEQDYYLSFARTLGWNRQNRPWYRLPITARDHSGADATTLVLAPGCKTGEMAAKRWPHYASLADCFDDVVIVGVEDDLKLNDGRAIAFPPHVRSFVGQLTLRETAEVIASAGVVVANDSGLGHVSGAVGTSTILLFGPTPDATLGRFPSHVRVLRSALACEPCWYTAKLRACGSRVDCLTALPVERVARAVSVVLSGRQAATEEDWAWSTRSAR